MMDGFGNMGGGVWGKGGIGLLVLVLIVLVIALSHKYLRRGQSNGDRNSCVCSCRGRKGDAFKMACSAAKRI